METEAVGIKAEDKMPWDGLKNSVVFPMLGFWDHFTNQGDVLYRRSTLEGHTKTPGIGTMLSSRIPAKKLELGNSESFKKQAMGMQGPPEGDPSLATRRPPPGCSHSGQSSGSG